MIDLKMVGYIFFGAIEAAGIFILMFYLFRFDAQSYLKEIAVASLLFPILTYIIRIELQLTPVSPLISIFIYAFAAYAILKIPAIWSLIISSLIYVIYFIVQTSIMLILISFNVVTLENVRSYHTDAFILQFISAVITTVCSHLLYKRGYGFSFPFNRFRFKGENLLMISTILIWYIAFLVLFITENLYYGVFIGTVILVYLLYLAIRKERSEV